MSTAPVSTVEPFNVFQTLRPVLVEHLSKLGIPNSIQALNALESQGRFGNAKSFIQESLNSRTPLFNTFIRFDSSLTPNLTFTMPPRRVKSVHSTYIKMDNDKSGSRVDLQGRVVYADSSICVLVDSKRGCIFAFTRQSPASAQAQAQAQAQVQASAPTPEQLLHSAVSLLGDTPSSIFVVPEKFVTGTEWLDKWRTSFNFPNGERQYALMSVYTPNHKGISAVLSVDIDQSEVSCALDQVHMTPEGQAGYAGRFFPSHACAYELKYDPNHALFVFQSGGKVIGASVVKIVDRNAYIQELQAWRSMKASSNANR